VTVTLTRTQFGRVSVTQPIFLSVGMRLLEWMLVFEDTPACSVEVQQSVGRNVCPCDA
jgi:hypothetical protein